MVLYMTHSSILGSGQKRFPNNATNKERASKDDDDDDDDANIIDFMRLH